MAKSIYRSGRVAHVWQLDRPEGSGYYLLMRGGKHLGPYRDGHHDISSGVFKLPRRRDTIHTPIFFYFFLSQIKDQIKERARALQTAVAFPQRTKGPTDE